LPEQAQYDLRVTKQERDKFEYVLGVIAGADQMVKLQRQISSESAWSDGVSISYRMDWRAIQNRALPELVVVLAHDGERQLKFDDHPMFVIFPRIRRCVYLNDDVTLIVEEPSPKRGDDVTRALKLLNTAASELDDSKRDNVKRMLSNVQRIFAVRV